MGSDGVTEWGSLKALSLSLCGSGKGILWGLGTCDRQHPRVPSLPLRKLPHLEHPMHGGEEDGESGVGVQG